MKCIPVNWPCLLLVEFLLFLGAFSFGSQADIDALRHVRIDGFSLSDSVLEKFQIRSLMRGKPDSIFAFEIEVFLNDMKKPQSFVFHGVSPDSDSIFTFLNRISNVAEYANVSLKQSQEVSIKTDSFFTLFQIVGSISENIATLSPVQVKNDLNLFPETTGKCLTEIFRSISTKPSNGTIDKEHELEMKIRETKQKEIATNPSYRRLRLPNGVQDIRAMKINLNSVQTEKAILSLFQILGVKCEVRFEDKGKADVNCSNDFVGIAIDKILQEKNLDTKIESDKVIVFPGEE